MIADNQSRLTGLGHALKYIKHLAIYGSGWKSGRPIWLSPWIVEVTITSEGVLFNLVVAKMQMHQLLESRYQGKGTVDLADSEEYESAQSRIKPALTSFRSMLKREGMLTLTATGLLERDIYWAWWSRG